MTDLMLECTELQRSPDPLGGFQGPTSKGKEGMEGKGTGGREAEGVGEEKEGDVRGGGCPVFFPEPTCQP